MRAAKPEETQAIVSNHHKPPHAPEEPYDPDDEPLTEEERRLDEIQARGLRERQADQERAGHRFDLLEHSEWGP